VSIIPATEEVEIRRITVQGQPRQKVSQTLSHSTKAIHGSIGLSSQLHEKHKEEDHNPG
jgi:hypothetical protein